MFSKVFYYLSKKASRKNLEVFISNSLQEASLKKREHKVLNIGAGGEIEKFIRKYSRSRKNYKYRNYKFERYGKTYSRVL